MLKVQAKAAAVARAAALAARQRDEVEKESQAEQTRLSSLSPNERQAEEEAKREVVQEEHSLARVQQNMEQQRGTGDLVLLMGESPSADTSINALASNLRRSTRSHGPVILSADEVWRLNAQQLRESRAQAVSSSKAPAQKGKRKRSKNK